MSQSEKILQHGNTHILYDAGLSEAEPIAWFDLPYQEKQGNIAGNVNQSGRGNAAILRVADRDWIIKHYRRGGLIAKFNDDCYLGFKLANSRSWVEWRLLQHMRSLQLPVPKPIAAQVNKNLLTYTADLITERLPDTQTLFHLLLTQALPADTWQAIGACIRRFHDHNIYHADLNANNILLTSDHKIYLIDFDRCRLKSDDNWQQGNLKRLLRSLNKLQTGNPDMHFAGSDWRNLLEGYGITSEREIDSLSGLKGHG